MNLLSDRRRKALAGAIIGILAWILMAVLYKGGVLEPYELKTYDQLCRLAAATSPAPEDIVLVVVDQGSLEAARLQGINWPWPRQMYAPILQFCQRAGARAVAFDILFTEPSSYGVEDDRLLAEALKENGRGYLPIILSRNERSRAAGEESLLRRISLPLQDQIGNPPSPYLSMVPPIRPLADGAHGLGNVAILPDADGIYRRLPLVFFYQGQWLPSLGLAVFRDLAAKGPLILQRPRLQVAGLPVPLDEQGAFLLHYYGQEFRRLSAFNVIQSEQALLEGGKPVYGPETLRDKIVFVGFTAPGLFDMKPTPLSPANPGVTVHATLVSNLIHHDFRMRLPPSAALGLTAAVCLAVTLTVMLVPTLWQMALLTAGYGAGLAALVIFVFHRNIWVDGILLAGGFGFSFAMASVFSYATEGRQKRQIKQAFSHYMSDLLIQDLLRHPEKLQLGGERRVLTVFFSDLAGFTSLSEKLSPEKVVLVLNRYLTAMTDIILASGGLIDKYEGDAIMAFWGAPVPQEDHALRACLAALDNQSRLVKLRQEFIAEGLPPIHARIGLNTGDMIIGNMGSSQRFDFTVIGDSVNLASRLEGAGKEYGTSIIISEDTYRQTGAQVEVRELDLLRVKGKEVPVRIYELLARKGELDEKKQQLRDLFERGLAFYRKRQWMEAISLFQQVLALDPEDGPSKTFRERSEQFRQTPPPSSWDGVYRLTSK